MIVWLKLGWQKVAKHSQLWLVVVLLFVLPTLFIVSIQSVVKASDANIWTIQKLRISSLHDLLSNSATSTYAAILERQPDVKKMVLLREEADTFFVLYDSNAPARVGEKELNVEAFISARIRPGETFIYNQERDGHTYSQAFRALPERLYIFTEHDFSAQATLLQSRLNNAYLTLSAIFIFIIVLAYWLARQIDYRRVTVGLESELKERDAFANTLVHELRAPLTAMRGYASLITESTSVGDTDREYARRIMESTSRLIALVNDFLEAVRIQSHNLQINRSTFLLEPVLHRVIQEFKPQAEQKGLELKLDLTNDKLTLYSDQNRLEQVLTNLVSNAIKYTNQGTVSLSLHEELKDIVITIADTGLGMDADSQRKLFQPFVRVGTAEQNAQITGTGLGMWITKKLVEQLEGRITVESIKGVGTHVRIILPKPD